MAHDKSTTDHNNEAGGNRRFRLPKLFADSDDTSQQTEETAERIAQRASALGVELPAPIHDEVIVAANRPYEGTPRASVLRMSPEEAAAAMKAEAALSTASERNIAANSSANAATTQSTAQQVETTQAQTAQVGATQPSATQANPPRATATPAGASSSNATPASTTPVAAARAAAPKPLDTDETPVLSGTSAEDVIGLGVARPAAPVTQDRGESVTAPPKSPDTAQRVLAEDRNVMRKLDNLEDGMEQMSRLLQEICDRGTAQEKVFDTLHSELQDYKNDFIYEHLKPVVRPLLFLYDSLEQFEEELALQERPQTDERRRGLSPALVRQNMAFFREQLVEALRICEVTPMQTPDGVFDAKCHKAVGIELVEQEQENHIQRVVRSGWYLNGHVFRPAEVVIG
jgi:molecular chaperone GrpE (heat shock protein)